MYTCLFSDVCLLTDLFDDFLCQWANKYTNWPYLATEHRNECFGSGRKPALCTLTFRFVTPVTINTAPYCDVALWGPLQCTAVSEYLATFIIRGEVCHTGRSHPRKRQPRYCALRKRHELLNYAVRCPEIEINRKFSCLQSAGLPTQPATHQNGDTGLSAALHQLRYQTTLVWGP